MTTQWRWSRRPNGSQPVESRCAPVTGGDAATTYPIAVEIPGVAKNRGGTPQNDVTADGNPIEGERTFSAPGKGSVESKDLVIAEMQRRLLTLKAALDSGPLTWGHAQKIGRELMAVVSLSAGHGVVELGHLPWERE